MYHVSFAHVGYTACGWWRVIHPLQHWHSEKIRVSSGTNFIDYDNINNIDLLVLQRPFMSCQGVIKQFQNAGKKVVIEVDDLFPVPKGHHQYDLYNPESPYVEELLSCMGLSDGIIVSTPELKTHYEGLFSQPIEVVLNALHVTDNFWQPKIPKDKFSILWSGGDTHLPNLKTIQKPLTQFLRDNSDTQLIMMSPLNDHDLNDFFPKELESQIIKLEPVELEKFFRMEGFNVSLAPLEFNTFNLTKSEIKILEAANHFTPCIATHIEPYFRFSVISEGACLLATSENDWYSHLTALNLKPKFRQKIGYDAYRAMTQFYNLQKWNKKREEFFIKLIET